MSRDSKIESINLLKEALNELENQKGSLLSGIQKINRAAKIVDNEQLYKWCEIQLGNPKYVYPLQQYISSIIKDKENKSKKTWKEFKKAENKVIETGLSIDYHCDIDELNVKSDKAGGGYKNIGFIEETYTDIVKNKKGNDGTYYQDNLNHHLNFIRRIAHDKATELYKFLAYSDTPISCFDILKTEIDDKLFDVDPELAEKLMISFESVSSNNPEKWSQALTTCRRIIIKLADILYPPTDKIINGRSLRKSNYINRLWVFMDESIESESNKELAKSHVDYIGNYLEKTHRLTQKGVHSDLQHIESVKTVFHLYLLLGDILNYLEFPKSLMSKKPNINNATLDEIESLLNVRRSIAKEIIKLRVSHGQINIELLSSVPGIGPKTLSKASKSFIFKPNK